MLRGRRIVMLAALCCLLAFPATAGALARSGGAHKAAKARAWIVKGAGFGHGAGMSQYGAYGYAKHGFDYQAILTHYYTGTTIGTVPNRTVRVLLIDGSRRVKFRGAGAACGVALKATKGYVAKRKGSGVTVRTKKGRLVARCGGVMTAAGAPTATVAGNGTYRGSLEVTPSGSGLQAVNVVGIEDYVRGVVSKESPSSWPIEALKAQAVAARSYGLSTGNRVGTFNLYDDTRSQVYAGVAAETPRTDQAVSATALQAVIYNGKVAQTFFFSTSGGHTENNELSSLGFGQPPVPYLRGVDDPYEAEAGSPYEHWKRKFSLSRMNSSLGGLVRGKLKNIVVTQRGTSPRIVSANLIGTRGTTTVNGPQLKDALGLPDTWAFFKKKK